MLHYIKYKDKSQAPIYDELYQCLYNDLISELKEYPGSLEYCKWFLDAQGCLQFYNEYAESWSTFRVPLTLFKNVVQPEYQDYAKGILQGYDFTPTIEERKMDISPNAASISNAKEEPVFVHRTYQYEDDVELDYFQVTGMQNVSRQREINDYLLQSVLDGAIEDISHIYLNNGYYEEGSNAYYWDSLIHVNSVIPDYYLNGQILSFAQTEEVTRKAYTTKAGVKKDELSKGPYLQAFNYDITKGKELTFGDVFEADDEFFDRIEDWIFSEDSGFMGWGSEWKWGYKNGIITPKRLDEAVTRILAMKACLKLYLPQKTEYSVEKAERAVGKPKYHQWAKKLADDSITLVKQEPGVLPLSPKKYPRLMYFPIETAGYDGFLNRAETFKQMLIREGFQVSEFNPSKGMEGFLAPTTEYIGKYDVMVYFACVSTRSNQTTVRIQWAEPLGANCPHYLTSVPTVFISVENPYHLQDVPRIRTYINAYSAHQEVLEEVLEKLMGRSEFKGESPCDPFCGRWDAHLQ